MEFQSFLSNILPGQATKEIIAHITNPRWQPSQLTIPIFSKMMAIHYGAWWILDAIFYIAPSHLEQKSQVLTNMLTSFMIFLKSLFLVQVTSLETEL